jgi:hypothetical protein
MIRECGRTRFTCSARLRERNDSTLVRVCELKKKSVFYSSPFLLLSLSCVAIGACRNWTLES